LPSTTIKNNTALIIIYVSSKEQQEQPTALYTSSIPTKSITSSIFRESNMYALVAWKISWKIPVILSF
jgi:hypothetical protein